MPAPAPLWFRQDLRLTGIPALLVAGGQPLSPAGRRSGPLFTAVGPRLGRPHDCVQGVTACFLMKHPLRPWQDSTAWFRNRLVGADLADNSAPWQWVAGRGSDAATRFRAVAASLKAAARPLAEAVA